MLWAVNLAPSCPVQAISLSTVNMLSLADTARHILSQWLLPAGLEWTRSWRKQQKEWASPFLAMVQRSSQTCCSSSSPLPSSAKTKPVGCLHPKRPQNSGGAEIATFVSVFLSLYILFVFCNDQDFFEGPLQKKVCVRIIIFSIFPQWQKQTQVAMLRMFEIEEN